MWRRHGLTMTSRRFTMYGGWQQGGFVGDREGEGKETGRGNVKVLSENDKTFSPPINTQKEIAGAVAGARNPSDHRTRLRGRKALPENCEMRLRIAFRFGSGPPRPRLLFGGTSLLTATTDSRFAPGTISRLKRCRWFLKTGKPSWIGWMQTNSEGAIFNRSKQACFVAGFIIDGRRRRNQTSSRMLRRIKMIHR